MLFVVDRVTLRSGGYLHFCGKFLDGYYEYKSRHPYFSSRIYIDAKSYSLMREFDYLSDSRPSSEIHVFPSPFVLYLAIWLSCIPLKSDNSIIFLNSTSASLFPFQNVSSILHDLKCFSERYSLKYFARRVVTALAVFNSSRVCCISLFTRDKFISLFASFSTKSYCLPTSLQVLPNTQSSSNSFNLSSFFKSFIAGDSYSFVNLIISTGHPHKNLSVLVDVFLENLEHLFVVVGPESNKLMFKESMPNVLFLSNLSNLDLHALYQFASCFLCPSTFEGMGLGAHQALFYSLPLLVSDISPYNLNFISSPKASFVSDFRSARSWSLAYKCFIKTLPELSPVLCTYPLSAQPPLVSQGDLQFPDNYQWFSSFVHSIS